ncbi:D-alanyl-D-alanine carboxypeptidase family protein [Ectobacillus sp. JY-23]|uniref:D-alanyl-D-alanine carboxypeptidase family protein n=1 Tax=Ectobacillus sp. JY-23 TaxID=2933872 RepID=UPI00248AAFF6|nr:D-alanyl-D-alanine carboxypeptidase family protein [Ectobacillus sp. JY-23]
MKFVFQNRVIATMMAFTLLFSMFFTYKASAESNTGLDIKGEAAILIEADSGKILYAKNKDQSLPIASMTKMMTEYLVHEAVAKGKIKWTQKTQASEYAHLISQDRSLSNVPLENGGSYTVKELYEAVAIYSANGAAIALAELISGSEGNFVKEMNKKAKELGLLNSKFVNSTGLTNSDLKGKHPEGTSADEENKMSASDSALLAQRLIKDYPDILDTAKITKKVFQEGGKYPVQMDNWNWMLKGLVYGYEGVDGLKTGSTPAAGYCFTGTAKRDNMRLIAVVIKTESYEARFQETKKLFDYGFSGFEMKELYKKGYQPKDKKTVAVPNGKEKEVNIETASAIKVPVPKGEKNPYQIGYSLNKGELKAPLKAKEQVGFLTVASKDKQNSGFLSGKELKVPLVTTEKVEKANWFVLTMRSIGSFFGNLWDSAVGKITG